MTPFVVTVTAIQISIHAPVKGATLCGLHIRFYAYNFNPRTREGCDLPGLYYRFARCLISIHAPVKGATPLTISATYAPLSISIHAPVKGATRVLRQTPDLW